MVQRLKELRALGAPLTPDPLRIVRMPEVQHRLGGICRNSVYSLVDARELPPPIPITSSGRAVGWLSRDIDAYIERRAQLTCLKKSTVLAASLDERNPAAVNANEAPTIVLNHTPKPAHTGDGTKTAADEIDALLRGAK